MLRLSFLRRRPITPARASSPPVSDPAAPTRSTENRPAGSTSTLAPSATVHIDLDGAQDIFEGRGWGYASADDPVFETGMRHALDFFAASGVKATLFVIARSLRDKRKRALIDEAARAGHELASHTLNHRYLTQLDTKGKREEIRGSRELMEQELGVPVLGFRAPGYRIDRESIELLVECGYAWDSSVFPTAKYATALGMPVETLRAPHTPIPGSDFVEWPMPDHRPFPLPFNPSYSLLLGDWLFRGGVRRFRAGGRPLSLLFHLIDFSEPLAADRLRGLASKVFTLSTLGADEKRARCHSMLRLVRDNYRIMTTYEAIAEWRGAQPESRVAASGGQGGGHKETRSGTA